MVRLRVLGGGMAILSGMLLLAGSGPRLDEAQRAGRETFPQADEDYFHDMDNGVALTPEEIALRNSTKPTA